MIFRPNFTFHVHNLGTKTGSLFQFQFPYIDFNIDGINDKDPVLAKFWLVPLTPVKTRSTNVR